MYEIYDIIDNINGKIRKNYPHELCYTLKFGLEINLWSPKEIWTFLLLCMIYYDIINNIIEKISENYPH